MAGRMASQPPTPTACCWKACYSAAAGRRSVTSPSDEPMPHAPHRLALLMIAAAMSFGEAAHGQAPPRQVLVDTAEPFAPGAEEQRVDTPSVFVWGTYQAGTAAGWHYRFYPEDRKSTRLNSSHPSS